MTETKKRRRDGVNSAQACRQVSIFLFQCCNWRGGRWHRQPSWLWHHSSRATEPCCTLRTAFLKKEGKKRVWGVQCFARHQESWSSSWDGTIQEEKRSVLCCFQRHVRPQRVQIWLLLNSCELGNLSREFISVNFLISVQNPGRAVYKC